MIKLALESAHQTVIVSTSLRTTTRPLSKLKSKVSCGNYKRTQQEVPAVFLLYTIYRWLMLVINTLF